AGAVGGPLRLVDEAEEEPRRRPDVVAAKPRRLQQERRSAVELAAAVVGDAEEQEQVRLARPRAPRALEGGGGGGEALLPEEAQAEGEGILRGLGEGRDRGQESEQCQASLVQLRHFTTSRLLSGG